MAALGHEYRFKAYNVSEPPHHGQVQIAETQAGNLSVRAVVQFNHQRFWDQNIIPQDERDSLPASSETDVKRWVLLT